MDLLRNIAEHSVFRKRVLEVLMTPSFFEGKYNLPLYYTNEDGILMQP